MFKKTEVLTSAACIATLFASSPGFAREKFERALILTGGGFNAPLYVGVVEGLIKSGWIPDVIIGTCGASVAAAIANAYPKSEDRKNYIERQSGGLFDVLTVPGINPDVTSYWGRGKLGYKAAGMASAASSDLKQISIDNYPDLFTGTILTIKDGFNDTTLNQKFHGENGAIRAVIVGSKLNYAQCDVGKSCTNQKAYQEVFFTDPDTATLLKGFKSPVGTDSESPNSAIQADTATVTDGTLGEAVRASISDPYLAAPFKKGENTYGPGVIDLHPVEAAQQLAKEVILVHDSDFGAVQEGAIRQVYGFSLNSRRAKALKAAIKSKIDLSVATDDDKGFDGLNLSPKINSSTAEITPRISKDNFQSYDAKEKAQLDLGQKAAVGAASQSDK